MLLYDKCSYPELHSFCEQRGIDTGAGHTVKADLVHSLEATDDASVFPSFEELPAELRLRVYCFSFQFFRHETLASSYIKSGARYERRAEISRDCDVFKLPPPPIARVCRLLRQEALPLFYERDRLVSIKRR
jgi:hypothetical protein